MGPVKRDKQVITQKFHTRHNGVDLRCVNDTFVNLPVIATESCQVLREGVDKLGNYFIVVRPLENDSFTELKYIHIMPTNHRPGTMFKPGDYISRCMVGGNSESLHLHFETWKQSGAVDPIGYFKQAGIEYKIKGEPDGKD